MAARAPLVLGSDGLPQQLQSADSLAGLLFRNANLLINGNFAVNQRAYASGGSLAAGAYAHDRWRAGSASTTYTFTQGTVDTQITVTASTLQQVVEPANSLAANVTLSWAGTAQARVYNLGASSPPAFSSGTTATVAGVPVNVLAVTGLAVGTSFVVEFATGTVGLAQLEPTLGSYGPTPFGRETAGETLAKCARYFRRLGGATGHKFGLGVGVTTTKLVFPLLNVAEKRIAPSIALSGTSPSLQTLGGSTNGTVAISAIAVDVADADIVSIAATTGTITVGAAYLVQAANATTFIDVIAEL